jgi:hypothetical protein
MLDFFSMCDFHKKTSNIRYHHDVKQVKTPPSKLIVKAKKNDNHQHCSITIIEGKIKLKTNFTEKKRIYKNRRLYKLNSSSTTEP